MAFYKRENEDLQVAPLFVSGPGLELTAGERAEYSYPVEGWWWFESLDEAMKHLISEPDVSPVEAAMSSLEAHYDTTAQQRNYDNRFTCALRAGYKGPFQAEGIAFAMWMDQCNELAYAAMPRLLVSNNPEPEVSEFISKLPAIVWPY